MRKTASDSSQAMNSELPRFPVFIVGSPRSGTSILVDALIGGGYNGYREGHLLSLISVIDDVVSKQFKYLSGEPGTLISQVDPGLLKLAIFEIFKERMQALNSRAPWFDKSGDAEMILGLPIIAELWPQSVFIFAKRRAIENVVSRLRKFPAYPISYHSHNWARTMEAWRAVRDKLPKDRWIEIDQRHILTESEDVAERLGCFLHLGTDQRQAVADMFKSSRPQQSLKGSAEQIYSLISTGWTESDTRIFLDRCQAELDAYGYSLDVHYFAGKATKSAHRH